MTTATSRKINFKLFFGYLIKNKNIMPQESRNTLTKVLIKLILREQITKGFASKPLKEFYG